MLAPLLQSFLAFRVKCFKAYCTQLYQGSCSLQYYNYTFTFFKGSHFLGKKKNKIKLLCYRSEEMTVEHMKVMGYRWSVVTQLGTRTGGKQSIGTILLFCQQSIKFSILPSLYHLHERKNQLDFLTENYRIMEQPISKNVLVFYLLPDRLDYALK